MAKKKSNKKKSKTQKKETKKVDIGLIIQITIIIGIVIFLGTLFMGQNSNSYNYQNNILKSNITSAGKTYGDENAPVTITMWSDFQCGFCKKFSTTTLPKIEKKYVDSGKVKIIYKHFPMHTYSQIAAEASECAAEQGKFWEYHKQLYLTNDFSKANLVKLAGQYDIDIDQFSTCLNSGKYSSIPKKEMQEGIDAGLKGTPHFLINNETVMGAQPYSVFEKIIEKELAKN